MIKVNTLDSLQNQLSSGIGSFHIKALVAIGIQETNKHNMPRKIGKILRTFDKIDDSKG